MGKVGAIGRGIYFAHSREKGPGSDQAFKHLCRAHCTSGLCGHTSRRGARGRPACNARTNNTYEKLLECVTVEGVREHQAAFQAIADANGGNRAAGPPGYDASVDYVVETLTAAGWNVTLDEFPFTFVPPAVLQQLTPVAATYETGAFSGSGTGSVTGTVISVDINLVPPRASTSGCEGAFTQGLNTAIDPIVPDPAGPDDFAGFPAGAIALVQRGTCSFALKAYNAQAAGASAIIIFNQGNSPDREALIIGNASRRRRRLAR